MLSRGRLIEPARFLRKPVIATGEGRTRFQTGHTAGPIKAALDGTPDLVADAKRIGDTAQQRRAAAYLRLIRRSIRSKRR
jgi:hypothetical protein